MAEWIVTMTRRGETPFWPACKVLIEPTIRPPELMKRIKSAVSNIRSMAVGLVRRDG